MIRPVARWLTVVGLLVFGVLALGACASKPEPTLYQRLGGTEGIAAVVDNFVDNVRADPRINKRFEGVDVNHTKAMLTDLVCQASGGPCQYTGRSMKDVHRGMDISNAEFDDMMSDMSKTLDKFQLPPRERNDVMSLLVSMRGDIVGQ